MSKRAPVVVYGFMTFTRYMPSGSWSACFVGSENYEWHMGAQIPEKHFGFKVYRAAFVVPGEFKPEELTPELGEQVLSLADSSQNPAKLAIEPGASA